jgi:lysophospholipase L1-like esterase
MGLRIAGFEHPSESVIRFGFPRPKRLATFSQDPDLFWVLPSSFPRLNSRGWIGPEIEIPKPDKTWRIAFFGDSCTQQGYPGLVTSGLEIRFFHENLTFESINLGVAGYSSYQGRILAERWAGRLEADAALFYFGWNDHWQAYGPTDEERGRKAPPPPPNRIVTSLVNSSRIAQWIYTRQSRKPLGVPRVSLQAYRANLLRMGEVLERAGTRVGLITAPSAHDRLGVPDVLIRLGFVENEQKGIELHHQYNDVVRQVAAEHGWHLLDLEAEVAALDDLSPIFQNDGIHFTRQGLKWVADRVAA